MKRYGFRLATVLRIRRAEQEQARARLLEANAFLRTRLAHRDREAARYRELARRSGARTAEALAAERSDAALAADSLRGAEQLVAGAATVAATAQVAWRVAGRRVAALERLEARRRAEYEIELRREEVAVVDDIVTARYVAAGAPDARTGAS